jgi:hypothetical protein
LGQPRNLAMDRLAQRLSQREVAGLDVDLHGGTCVELPLDPTGDQKQNK